jgi:antitoxin VapB
MAKRKCIDCDEARIYSRRMALSIRKRSVETKARHLAARRGLSMTGAIEQALDNELARDHSVKEREFQEALAKLRNAQASFAANPPSGLTEQDIMGWDENGLPT